MSRFALVPAVLLGGLLAAGLGMGAVADRSPSPSRTTPGFGQVSPVLGEARTDEWRSVAGAAPGVDPQSSNGCERGDEACLDAVVVEMEARLSSIGCAHTAPFAFTYLEMTRGVRDRTREPGFFRVPAATANFDAVFAQLYFDAFDSWAAGRIDEVTPAWQVAFRAAEDGGTTAAADLLLGMNAHISRDLAYVVESAIRRHPELADDPRDFTKINDVIARVKSPMLAGAADRFDPSLIELDRPLPAIAGTPAFDVIALWRDRAFEDGRRLAAAGPDERRAVGERIDREALANAVLILNADAAEPLTSAGDRDAHCQARQTRDNP